PSIRRIQASLPRQRAVSPITSPESTTVPLPRPGSSPPAIPKLMRHPAPGSAASTRLAVSPASPPPTIAANPALRATAASAASPQTQSAGRPSKAKGDSRRIRPRQAAVAGQCPEREKGAVSVVAEIKHPRKPDRGEPRLVPGPVRLLRPDQVLDPPRHGPIAGFPGRHQPEHRPGGLRRRAVFGDPMRHAGVVALLVLAPAAIRALPGHQPRRRTPHLRRRRFQSGGVQRRESRPGAVDVIGAPAPEPAAVRLLL